MLLYAQAWLPLFTIALAAALCFGVASIFMQSMSRLLIEVRRCSACDRNGRGWMRSPERTSEARLEAERSARFGDGARAATSRPTLRQ